jgi:class 3 adenylate cyclase
MRLGIGHSLESDAQKAVAEAIACAKEAVPEPQFALVFGSIHYDQEALHAALVGHLPGDIIIGGTSYAEISTMGVTKRSFAILLLSLERGKIRFFETPTLEDPSATGKKLAEEVGRVEIGEGHRPVAFLMSDFGTGRENELIDALLKETGCFPLFGGMAASDYDLGMAHEDFRLSYQYGPELSRRTTRLALFELPQKEFFSAFGFEHGWEPIGPPVTLTKCDGSKVYEVDGMPIFDYYRQFIGEQTSREFFHLMIQRYAFSLEIAGEESSRAILKLPVVCDFDAGFIDYYPSEPLQDKSVRMILSSRSGLLDGARRAAEECKKTLGGRTPAVVFVVSCCTRNAILHSKSGTELDVIREVFGAEVPVFGYYSGGEFLPFCNAYEDILDTSCALSGTHYHTATMGLWALCAEEPVEQCLTPPARIALWDARTLRDFLLQGEMVQDQTEKFLANMSKKSYEDSKRIREQNAIIQRYTPQEVWAQVDQTLEKGEREIHNAEFDGCYMFLDVKGFTSFSETHTSSEVVEALNQLFGPATDTIYRYKGDVDKFIGDCIFAVFKNPKDALIAGRDILQLFNSCKEKGHPFSVRIGINGGRAVRANLGSSERREYTYIGDAVNAAQRLESNCTPGKMLVAWGLYEKAGVPFAGAEPKNVQVKGKAEPIRAYELTP